MRGMRDSHQITIENLLTYAKIYNFDINAKDVEKINKIVEDTKDNNLDTFTHNYFIKKVSDNFILGVNPWKYNIKAELYPVDNTATVLSLIDSGADKIISMNAGNILLAYDVPFSTLKHLKSLAEILETTYTLYNNKITNLYVEGHRDLEEEGADYWGNDPEKAPHKEMILNSENELKEFIRKGLFALKSDKLGTLEDATFDALAWVLDAPKIKNRKIKYEEFESVPDYVSYIMDVITLSDNARIAVGTSNFSRYYSKFLSYYVVYPEDRQYNYTDPGRFFIPEQVYSRYRGSNNFVPGNIYFTDDAPVFPENEDIFDTELRRRKFLTVDNRTIDKLIVQNNRLEASRQAEANASRQIKERLQGLIDGLEDNKPFSFNDMDFTNKTVTYEGQVISNSGVDVSKVLHRLSYSYRDDHLNFDRVFETLLAKAYHATNKVGVTTGTIGNINYTLKKENRITPKSKSSVWKINDIRINAQEVVDSLSRALCYDKVEDYNLFLKKVSKCSIRIHKYLASGISLNVRDNILNERLKFKIILKRVKNRNYIQLGKDLIPIKNIGRLLAMVERHHVDLPKIIDTLLNDKIVGLTAEQIGQIIRDGRKLWEEEAKKDKETLEETLKLFDVQELSAQLKTNKTVNGYLVNGQKRQYVIDKEDLKVYEYPTGRYLCMVDKGQNEYANNARLINRIYALANDSRLAKMINTLQ